MHPKDKQYQFYGYYEFTASMSSNSMRAGQKGPQHVKFADGQHIRYSLMDYKLGGTVMGERTVESIGNMVFEDLTNNVKAVICFNTYKENGWFTKTESGRKDAIYGLIYKPNEEIDPVSSFQRHYVKGAEDINHLSKLDNEIGEKIAEIEGSLLRELNIGETKYWDIDKEVPFRQVPMLDKQS